MSAAADQRYMARALELARRGAGFVEPNPLVGCVIVADPDPVTWEGAVIAEGWHERFGGPHAEIQALRGAVAGVPGATMYVTLEPCGHHGKTPPCTEAILAAGIRRVVVAHQDPFPAVSGQGLEVLRRAGVQVEVGVLEAEARQLNAPYLKRVQTGRPWIIAKWAMTWDGKLATRQRHSQWISNDQSRSIVHQLRGRMDAILIGHGTAEADDPRLTARPPGPRVATRIVLDSHARLSHDSQLVRTAHEAPLMVATQPFADRQRCQDLRHRGVEILELTAAQPAERLAQLLDELGRRQMTNVLVEGGSRVLGCCWDGQFVDEVQVFLAPKLIGGADALTPIAGYGHGQIPADATLEAVHVESLGSDLYLRARVAARVSP